MNTDYDVYSTFDIEKHKATFINYFEAILLPSGEVVYAVPSHVEKLIELTGESRETVWATMPVTAHPLTWLLAYTGCVSMWSYFHKGDTVSAAQAEKLQELIDAGLTKGRDTFWDELDANLAKDHNTFWNDVDSDT